MIRIACAAILLVVSVVGAHAKAGHLTAYSRTARSITGNVVLTKTKISFGNGKSLAIKQVASQREGHWSIIDDKESKADVYELEHPQDPELLNGNTWCGGGPVRYFAVNVNDGLTGIIVFDPDADPFGNDPDRVCATYNYE